IRIDYVDGIFRQSAQCVKTNREIVERVIRQGAGQNKAELVRRAQAAGVPKHRAESLLSDGARAGWLTEEIGSRGAKTYCLAPRTGSDLTLPECDTSSEAPERSR